MKKNLMVMAAMLFVMAMPVSAANFELGQHYGEIYPVPAVRAGNDVEVQEFFMYLCPHCKELEPELHKWLKTKPDNIKFSQVPALFGGAANLHAKMFYALEAIGERKRLHAVIFNEIHNKNKRLQTRDAIDAFLERNGVDLAKFRSAMSSFGVSSKTNTANSQMRAYGIRSVPTLVVDGRYRTGNTASHAERIEVVKFLVDKVLRERTASTQN